MRELARLSVEAESEAARVAASKEILDRAYGKAHQSIEASIKRDVRDLSEAELLAAIAALGGVAPEAGEAEHSRLH
jgi:hypothetical protein